MGTHLLEPQPDNPKGFFENKYFVHLNDLLLKNAGGTWYDPPSREDLLEANKHMGYTIEAVVKQESREPIWGWKDPRTTITAELYLPYLKSPHFVCVYRKPIEVASSLRARDGWELERGLRLAKEYNDRMSAFMKRWLNS